MRQGLLLAVGALSTIAQGAVVDNREDRLQGRQIINVAGNGVEIEGNGAVEVKTIKAENIQGLTGGGDGILAGILGALTGGNGQNGGHRNSGHRNKGHKNKNKNCPAQAPPPAPMTVTKTVFRNASVPAPLTVFVTQAAPPALTVTMTQTCAPPPKAPPPAAPAAPAAPPSPPPAANPPPATTPPTPPPVAAEPPAASPPAAQPAPPAASAPAAPAQGGSPAKGNNPTTSLNLGGLNGGNPAGAAANPAVPAATPPPPIANNPAAQPNIAVSGLDLSKSLVLGNLLQKTIGLQAGASPEAQVHAEVMPADWQEQDGV